MRVLLILKSNDDDTSHGKTPFFQNLCQKLPRPGGKLSGPQQGYSILNFRDEITSKPTIRYGSITTIYATLCNSYLNYSEQLCMIEMSDVNQTPRNKGVAQRKKYTHNLHISFCEMKKKKTRFIEFKFTWLLTSFKFEHLFSSWIFPSFGAF